MLVGLLQLRDCGLVVARIKRNVAGDIRIEARLVRIVGLIEGGLRRRNMLLRFFALIVARGDASLRALPAEQPQVLVGVR